MRDTRNSQSQAHGYPTTPATRVFNGLGPGHRNISVLIDVQALFFLPGQLSPTNLAVGLWPALAHLYCIHLATSQTSQTPIRNSSLGVGLQGQKNVAQLFWPRFLMVLLLLVRLHTALVAVLVPQLVLQQPQISVSRLIGRRMLWTENPLKP